MACNTLLPCTQAEAFSSGSWIVSMLNFIVNCTPCVVFIRKRFLTIPNYNAFSTNVNNYFSKWQYKFAERGTMFLPTK
jgi:hypothetical protein